MLAIKRIIAVFLWIPFAVACTAASPTVAEDLASRTYILQTVNGEVFVSKERTPEISFNEGMRIAGQICNRFMGQGILKDGILTMAEMASTMMLCPDERLNAMEQDFAAMLRQGAEVALRGTSLTLRGGGSEYIYAQKP